MIGIQPRICWKFQLGK